MIAIAEPERVHRAAHTVGQLDLNDQPLQDERAEKLKSVVYLLARVVREQPIEPDTRERLRAELHPHRPYLGVIRFLLARATPYRKLVNAARAKLPDIDTWVSAWL